MADDPAEIPPTLARALAAPTVPPKRWQDGVAPAFITLFLGAVFLDRLAPSTLLVGGLGPAVIGAVMAGLLGYWCLYYAPALWGASTRRPLAVVSASTFGARGAAWVPGLLIGVVYVLWFAITIDYATEYTLSALASCGLLDPKHLAVRPRGSIRLPMPLFLFVAGSWTIASAIIGTLAVRLVAAVMSVYPIFPAIALGLTLLWAIPTAVAGPVATRPLDAGGGLAMAAMVQIIFAFLACHGLTAADWGAASPSTRDARAGGMVGIMLAAPILAILSLLIVAGALGKVAPPAPPPQSAPFAPVPRPGMGPNMRIGGGVTPLAPRTEPGISTLREVYSRAIGGRLGGAGLFILALGLLGPACFIPSVIARQCMALWPRVPRWAWSLLGAIASWPLIATGAARDVEFVFGLIGGLTAPAVGAIAADYSRQRGAWPGPRAGVNLAGIFAWFLGVASVPIVSATARSTSWGKFVPPSVVAFAVGFVAYHVLAMARLEPKPIAIPEAPPGSPPTAIPS